MLVGHGIKLATQETRFHFNTNYLLLIYTITAMETCLDVFLISFDEDATGRLEYLSSKQFDFGSMA